MAVYSAPQYVGESVDQKRLLPFEEHGKFRANYAFFKNLTGGALAIGDEINLFKLPPSNVRLLPYLSRLRNTAATGVTVAIGFRGYTASEDAGPIAAAPNELLAPKSIATADNAALSQIIKYDVYSKRGIIVYATLAGAGLPANAELELILPYLYE